MRHPSKWLRGVAATSIVALGLNAALSPEAISAGAAPTAACREIATAVSALDRYSGRRSDLDEAELVIGSVLERDPGCTDAWVEKARHRMKQTGRLEPDVLRGAEADLRTGLRSQPNHGNAYVLLGYVLAHQRRFDEAKAAFDRAREERATSPWLVINVAQMHMLREDLQAAEPLYRRALADPRLPSDVRSGVVDDFARALAARGQADRARALYEELLARDEDPGAWLMGNYSTLLRDHFLDIKASETWGRRALAKMNYGVGRENLGSTLYFAWAEALIVEKNEAKAAKLYAEAQTYKDSPDDLLYEMTNHPRGHPIIAALASRGVPLDYDANFGPGRATPPLMTLIPNDNVAVATALLDAGANVEVPGVIKTTPLIVAAKHGKIGMTRLLLSRGADLDATDKDGVTAEEAARGRGHAAVADLIAAERKARGAGQKPPQPL